jgi:Na+:H+ antiporter, NhaA family
MRRFGKLPSLRLAISVRSGGRLFRAIATGPHTAAESYFRFAHALRFSVNDIGMVFFIGLITEEVLEAVMPGGALYRWRRTLLPVVAALGGVLGATAVYLLYLQSHYEFMLLDGWPVAAALDVAFAYFIAKAICLRREGPIAFLLLIAVVSDALGVVSIAIWFPAADGYPAALGLMAVAILIAAWLRSALASSRPNAA